METTVIYTGEHLRQGMKDPNEASKENLVKEDFKYIDATDDHLENKEAVKGLIITQKDDEKNVKQNDPENVTLTNDGVKFLGLDDNDSICSSTASQETSSVIPDGGWGWVVVAASFLIAAVADGLAFSYGLMHDKFVSFFETSEAKTSLIGSLFLSVPLIAGPVMSALVDRYGCKNMTIFGGIISTIGFVAASYSNSVEVLYVTYGVIAGLGMGLLYVTAVVSIAYWFEKRRNLAVGLGSCGVGFGTFIYSPLTTYLLDEYGWRGTILLLAGTVLNVCVCGAVMRDPDWLIMEQKQQKLLEMTKKATSTASISARSAKSGGAESVYPGTEELKTLMESGKTPDHILMTLVSSIEQAENLEASTKINSALTYNKVNSAINLPTFLSRNEKISVEVLEQLRSNTQLYNFILQNHPSLLALKGSSEHKISVGTPITDTKDKSLKEAENTKNKIDKKDFQTKLTKVKQNLLNPQQEQKILRNIKLHHQDWISKSFGANHHYLRDIRVHRNSIMHRGAMMNIAKYRLRASSCPNIYKNSMWSVAEDEEQSWSKRLTDILNKTFDFNMFTEFHFLMMNLSSLVLFIWFIVPYFYISNFMVKSGYTEKEGSLMLSVFGVATIIGIVGLGWLGDLPWVNVTKTYAICLVVCGFSILMFPVIIRVTDSQSSYSFYILAANAVVFGLMFSSSYSYTPSILVELIALERFTTAYGLVLLSQGLGHLVGPPMAGALKDITGYWDAAFYIAGIWVIVSGLLVLVIPYTTNFRVFGNAPLAKDISVQPDPGVKFIVTH